MNDAYFTIVRDKWAASGIFVAEEIFGGFSPVFHKDPNVDSNSAGSVSASSMAAVLVCRIVHEFFKMSSEAEVMFTDKGKMAALILEIDHAIVNDDEGVFKNIRVTFAIVLIRLLGDRDGVNVLTVNVGNVRAFATHIDPDNEVYAAELTTHIITNTNSRAIGTGTHRSPISHRNRLEGQLSGNVTAMPYFNEVYFDRNICKTLRIIMCSKSTMDIGRITWEEAVRMSWVIRDKMPMRLCEHAYRSGSNGNLTVVAIFLEDAWRGFHMCPTSMKLASKYFNNTGALSKFLACSYATGIRPSILKDVIVMDLEKRTSGEQENSTNKSELLKLGTINVSELDPIFYQISKFLNVRIHAFMGVLEDVTHQCSDKYRNFLAENSLKTEEPPIFKRIMHSPTRPV
jgi:hypothetical protein